jgi:hypothetical protein
MNVKHSLKKLEADKIALLGLFVLALLIGQLIVKKRSALIFSEPIELAHSGLSISIPVGNGWESERKWQYHENAFSLSSYFIIGSTKPAALAVCRYILAAESISPETWFEQKAVELNGVIEEINRIQKDNLNIDWAQIEHPDTILSIFLGTVELPYDRQLNIEVHQMTLETGLAEKVFTRVIESLVLEDKQQLNNGIETIAKIKSKGLNSFLDNQSKQTNFLIQNLLNRSVGFAIEVLINSDSNDNFNIEAASHLYLTEPDKQEQGAFFRGKNNLEEFIWQSRAVVMGKQTYTKTILYENGIITVIRNSNLQTYEKSYNFGPTMIPEIFIESILSQMLQDNFKEITIDIIDSDGAIIPMFASFIESREDISADEDAAYVVKLELMGEQDLSELVYLDQNKQISRVILQQPRKYILERTSLENIAAEFPERADEILKRNEKLQNIF